MAFSVEAKRFAILADELGAEAALRLCAFSAGHSVYVPGAYIPGHILEGLLGEEAFLQLIAHYGGETISAPAMEMTVLRRAGMLYRLGSYKVPTRLMADATGVSPRRVRQVIDELVREGMTGLAEKIRLGTDESV